MEKVEKHESGHMSGQPAEQPPSTMRRVPDVAQCLNVSLSQAYELIASGQIAHFRFGGAIRVAEADLSSYIARCKKG